MVLDHFLSVVITHLRSRLQIATKSQSVLVFVVLICGSFNINLRDVSCHIWPWSQFATKSQIARVKWTDFSVLHFVIVHFTSLHIRCQSKNLIIQSSQMGTVKTGTPTNMNCVM